MGFISDLTTIDSQQKCMLLNFTACCNFDRRYFYLTCFGFKLHVISFRFVVFILNEQLSTQVIVNSMQVAMNMENLGLIRGNFSINSNFMYNTLVNPDVCDVFIKIQTPRHKCVFSNMFNYKIIILKEEPFSVIPPHPELKPLYKTMLSPGLPNRNQTKQMDKNVSNVAIVCGNE